METIYCWITLLLRQDADKVVVFLMNEGFYVGALAAEGTIIPTETKPNSLSHIAALSIQITQQAIKKHYIDKKSFDKMTPSNKCSLFGDMLKNFLIGQDIKFYSFINVLSDSGHSSNWHIGNIFSPDKNDGSPYRDKP